MRDDWKQMTLRSKGRSVTVSQERLIEQIGMPLKEISIDQAFRYLFDKLPPEVVIMAKSYTLSFTPARDLNKEAQQKYPLGALVRFKDSKHQGKVIGYKGEVPGEIKVYWPHNKMSSQFNVTSPNFRRIS